MSHAGWFARMAFAVLDRVYTAIARLAPSSMPDVRETSARSTFRAVCLAALARGGVPALVREGTLECIDLSGVVMRARIGGRPRTRRAPVAAAWRDLRLAWRSLRAGRTTTMIAAGTLALGIGINAAVFSVLDAVLWRPVPFQDAARLGELWNFSKDQKFSFSGFSRPLVQEWRRQTDLFDQLEAYDRNSFIYQGPRGSEMIAGAIVTPGTFGMLGARAALGRTFAADEGRGGSSRLAVISDAFWRERLGSPSDITTRDVVLNGIHHRVIGVMPASFRFPTGVEELWTPYDVEQPPAGTSLPATMTPYVRRAPAVSFEAASREVAARGERVVAAAGGPPGVTASLMQAGGGIDDRTERSLWVLAAAVGFLFLIVCANVANLALSRSLSRARVLATCSAMGASPMDLVRATLFEQMLLAMCGAAAGVAVAALALEVLVVALPATMTASTLNVVDLDGRVLVFMLAAGTGAAVLFGLPPAMLAARTSLMTVLGRDGRTSTGSRPARRFRSALAVAEVAVSVVLLVGAALMTRSFVKLASVDQGYDSRGLISVRLGLPAAGYRDIARRDRVARDVAARAALVPGVAGVTVGGLPSEPGGVIFGRLEFDHRPGDLLPSMLVPVHEVPSTYFRVLGIRIEAGRVFADTDVEGAVVVNQRFAARYFRTGDAVGRRFRVEGGPWRTIVGVAANTLANSESGRAGLELFYPIGTASEAMRPTMAASVIADFRTVLVRAERPELVIRQLSGAVHAEDPSIVIWKTALVEHVLADAIARPRVVFLMMTVFAAFGLLLAMAGLYGVLSCLVAQRRQEMGVRLALGATSSSVRWLVLGNGLALTATGIGLGLLAAIPLVRAMRALLYDVNPSDPFAMIGAALILLATATFACWFPARDAGRINPVDLLRGT